jgi:hypothetical protein
LPATHVSPGYKVFTLERRFVLFVWSFYPWTKICTFCMKFLPLNEVLYQGMNFYLDIKYCTSVWIFYLGMKFCTYVGITFCTYVGITFCT